MRSEQARKYTHVKDHVASVQGKAKGVGFLYLIGILAIAAIALVFAVLSLAKAGIAVELTVMKFWKIFKDAKGAWKANAINLAVAGIYGLMVLILVINVLRAFGKLNWLYKNKASRLYGFNRNMYAMDDLGRIFSGSLATVIVCNFIIVLLASSVKSVKIEMYAYILLGVGIFFHFLCGLIASKVSLFETEGGITEIRREVGVAGSFFRNLLQIIIVAAIGYFLMNFSQIRATVDTILADGAKATFKNYKELILPGAQLLILIWTIGMVTYATGTTEYDLEGAQAPGRKGFLGWSIVTFLTAGGAYAYFKFVAKTAIDKNMLIIAIIAFVAIILELILINVPRARKQQRAGSNKPESDDVDMLEYVKQTYVEVNYNKPGVYLTQPPVQNTVPQTYAPQYVYEQNKRK